MLGDGKDFKHYKNKCNYKRDLSSRAWAGKEQSIYTQESYYFSYTNLFPSHF